MSLSLHDYQSDTALTAWIAELGCTDAVIPRRNLKVALEFFATQMPELSLGDAVSFLAAMDLSKPVNRVYLKPGDRVIGWRTASDLSPFKLFFARRGNSPHRSGINPAGRGPVHFVVNATVLSLESFTSGAIDTWTPRPPAAGELRSPRMRKWFGNDKDSGVMAMGGGQQLIIPGSASKLLVEQRG